MRVGIVVPGFSASESDWCVPAILSLVRRMSERHHLRVFALRYPYQRARYPVFSAQVQALGGARARGLARLALLRRAGRVIRLEHRREAFDVLHAIWADEPGYVAVTTGRALGVPSVVTLFGGELVSLDAIGYGGLRSRLNRLLVARALKSASRVTAGSTRSAELARSRRVELLPIGVDLDRFRPDGPRTSRLAGEPRLLHVASLVPVKDQETLLRAFAIVCRSHPRAILNVVGEGPLEGELRRLSRELGIEERVVLHGAIPHDQLPPYYRAADLLVMSSLHEGQELVVLEAAACGRAAVGTNVGVLADLEPAAIAVPVKDPAALADGISKTLSDRCRRSAMEILARNQVVERYSLAGTIATLTALYQELAKDSPDFVPGVPTEAAGFRTGASP